MGNSWSETTRNVSVEKEILLPPRMSVFNSAHCCDCETVALRVFEREFARQSMAGTLLTTPKDHLETALAPFRKIATPPDENAPKEQRQLQLCLRKNETDGLRCQKEINDFVAFVNKPSPM